MSSNHEPAVLAYVAGIIDGEGCISIVAERAKMRSAQTTHPYHCLYVGVANTDKSLIEFLHERFGGSTSNGHRPNRKPYYKWSVTSHAAENFLRLVYPFLLIKKRQAEIAFAFRETFNEKIRLTTERLNERNSFYIALKQIKRAA